MLSKLWPSEITGGAQPPRAAGAGAVAGAAWLRVAAGVLFAAVIAAASAGRAGAAADRVPATIRVGLTVPTTTLRIEPPPGAAVLVDSRRVASASQAPKVIAGRALRYLTLATDRLPGPMRALGVQGPAAGAAPDALLVGPYGPEGLQLRHRRLLYAEIGIAPRVTPPGPGLRVGDWATRSLPASLRIVPEDARSITLLNDRPYRGSLEIRFGADDAVVVNEVAFGDYLASVVGAEMPSSWEMEALKAQAVAARNYALHNLRPGAVFDICDNQNCQAYKGVASESERTRLAVDATGGVVATFAGELIQAFYSANAGDYTESAQNVWGEFVPYLAAVPSPRDIEALSVAWGAEGYRWVRTIALERLRDYRAFQRAGIGEIIDLRVLERAESGRPLRLEVIGSLGSLELVGDQIRTAFGLPSAFVEIALAPAEVLQLINPTARRRAALLDDGFEIESLRRSVAFAGAPAGVRLYNSAVTVVRFVEPARVVFNGRGFGHGVGMSQWGAQGMALAGRSFEEILRHYYPGIELSLLRE